MTLYANTETGELVFQEEIEAGPRPVLNAEQLLEQLTRLQKEINTRKEDMARLIKDTKFHKKTNPQGIDAYEVKQIKKSAVRLAASDYEEKKIEALTFFSDFERITNYND
jgi:hypothetical protein